MPQHDSSQQCLAVERSNRTRSRTERKLQEKRRVSANIKGKRDVTGSLLDPAEGKVLSILSSPWKDVGIVPFHFLASEL